MCGTIYNLTAYTKIFRSRYGKHWYRRYKMPDFDTLQPIGRTIIETINEENRSYLEQIKHVPVGLLEWYGIRIGAYLVAKASGRYQFKLTSDDGSRLYINGIMVIDNDGLHPEYSRTGSIYLKKGKHKIKVEYYQGPRFHVAWQLFWKTPHHHHYHLSDARDLATEEPNWDPQSYDSSAVDRAPLPASAVMTADTEPVTDLDLYHFLNYEVAASKKPICHHADRHQWDHSCKHHHHHHHKKKKHRHLKWRIIPHAALYGLGIEDKLCKCF